LKLKELENNRIMISNEELKLYKKIKNLKNCNIKNLNERELYLIKNLIIKDLIRINTDFFDEKNKDIYFTIV
jgi:hypothetical protein